MELYARIIGEGPPIVLLHGLFGSNENLGGVARALGDRYTVYGLDLRNHGRSPQAESMDYSSMAADVNETLDHHGLDEAIFIGHSMGGKTAMELALSTPNRVAALIVVDIAPIAYDRRHDQELDALQGLDPSDIRSRGEADATLAERIPSAAVRQFLLKNLIREGKGFAWRIPLETIYRQYDRIAAAPSAKGPYNGPTLFIRGGNSDYLPTAAEATVNERFPRATIVTLANLGHWPHAESPHEFVHAITGFLDALRTSEPRTPSR
ncbi:alpha/beta fold hydrolase [Halofilum ochraceum]|uniref:alpha/beta fold hydrolase n=1 Tax=Halofilum ochraceum TaxID=1611323 RepID=UPI0008D9CFEC|nr:alpha/beta fold hydrolase [Halofilum ochraceum]